MDNPIEVYVDVFANQTTGEGFISIPVLRDGIDEPEEVEVVVV